MNDMFRFFDKDFDNQISFREFRVSCEELDFRFSNEEIKLLFSYIDADGGGTIGYDEFINLSEERRRGLDPLQNARKNAFEDKVF